MHAHFMYVAQMQERQSPKACCLSCLLKIGQFSTGQLERDETAAAEGPFRSDLLEGKSIYPG